jgi:hypothetical protein
MEEARKHVERMCAAAWRIYQTDPKSMKSRKLLLGSLAKAQMVGLEGPTADRLQQEVDRLINAGEFRKTRTPP